MTSLQFLTMSNPSMDVYKVTVLLSDGWTALPQWKMNVSIYFMTFYSLVMCTFCDSTITLKVSDLTLSQKKIMSLDENFLCCSFCSGSQLYVIILNTTWISQMKSFPWKKLCNLTKIIQLKWRKLGSFPFKCGLPISSCCLKSCFSYLSHLCSWGYRLPTLCLVLNWEF